MDVFKKMTVILCLCLMFNMPVPYTGNPVANAEEKAQKAQEPSKLLVLWTSGDREVAIKVAFMYTYFMKKSKSWDEVCLVVWGPSAKLLSEDRELQDYIKKMKDEGVILQACKACSDMYGVSDTLSTMGIDVKYMGKPLTDMLKSGWVNLAF
ncbi:MAG: DsrE family protein [Candidatus Latescibacterota bacterium]|jgi:hypothetical protein